MTTKYKFLGTMFVVGWRVHVHRAGQDLGWGSGALAAPAVEGRRALRAHRARLRPN